MKFLIINQFENSEKFDKFIKYFKRLLKKNLIFQDTNHNLFICKNKEETRKFIFEYNSPYENVKAGKNFNQIDLVIINGDKGTPPWNNSLKEIFHLIRMCIRSNKPTFISGGSCLNFIFSLSTNLLKKDFITKPIKTPHFNNAFIDISTGDVFNYNWKTKKWNTEVNCGMHHITKGNQPNSFQKNSFGNVNIKINKNPIDPNKFHIKGDPKENICVCNKYNIKHYLFNNIPIEFKIPFITSYIIHPISFINKERKFTILANSTTGPMIFEYKNIISTIFPIDLKYNKTITLLENYLNHIIPIIKMEKIDYTSVFLLKDSNEDKANLDLNKATVIEENKKLNRYINSVALYKNSGLAMRSKYANDIIINSSIQKNNINSNIFKQKKIIKKSNNFKITNDNIMIKKNKIDLLENVEVDELNIRKKLHPNYNFSKNTQNQTITNKNTIYIKNNNHDNFYKSKFKYNIKMVDEWRSKPMVRCSSAYTTAFQQQNLQKTLNNQKIIAEELVTLKNGTIINRKKDFWFKKIDGLKPCYMDINTKFRPVSNHKFKEINKNKWMDKKFYLI